MALPQALRRLAPEWARDNIVLRGLAVGSGLIPPRTMHTERERVLLTALAHGRRVAVEIGVYEGSSALALCAALPLDATLHLIDPFTGDALRPGWRGVEHATRRVVARATRRRGGPTVRWHVERSAQTAARWSSSIDFLFIDGDHSEQGCRLDWDRWSTFVADGGIVLIHDARSGRPGGRGLPGPTSVVDGLFRAGATPAGWSIADEVDSLVAVRRSGPPAS